jgi:hypothetical protein
MRCSSCRVLSMSMGEAPRLQQRHVIVGVGSGFVNARPWPQQG